MQFRINKVQFIYQDEELYINGKLIECPQKILQALILFVTSKNEIISKDTLLYKLWGELIVSEDSLFKVVQGVRKIFKENGVDGDVLINVYGKGYKINPKIKKAFFQIPTKEIPIIVLQNKINHKSFKRSIILSIGVLLALGIGYVLYSKQFADQQVLITDEIYNTIQEQIRISPAKSLLELNENYKIENSTNEDKMKLFFLRAWAYYKQGDYKNSLQNLENGKNLYTGKPSRVAGDIYYLLTIINLYRSDSQLMSKYLNKAEEIFVWVNEKHVISRSASLVVQYHILIHEYDQAIEASNKLLTKAQKYDNYVYQIKAHIDLSHVYFELNDKSNRQLHLQAALEIALEKGYGKYISYAYGTMVVDSMNSGEFIKAMNWVNKTLAYTVVQSSTNDFQQGFSYLYNVLSPLGHDGLAEFYLQKGIDIQNKFNSDGHLHLAETNLGILKIKLKKYKQAQQMFEQLLSYNLSFSERSEVQAWKAINHYYLNDSISSYAIAKEIYNTKNITNKIKLVAGIGLILSATDLERNAEAELIFQQISQIANPNWLIEYNLYLNIALDITQHDIDKQNIFLVKRSEFDSVLLKTKEQATADPVLLIDLNNYINRILQ